MIAPLHNGRQALAPVQPRRPAAVPDVKIGTPNGTWSRHDLDERADWEVSKLRYHRNRCPAYWWLGKVMSIVEPGLSGEECETWRERHHINRTCAYRSLLFVQAFSSPDELIGLGVLEAIRLASERLGRPAPQTEAEARIHRRLVQLKKKTLPDCLADLDGVPDMRRLLPLVAEAGELYRRFEEALGKRVAARATTMED